ncbi:MAG TPA: hypothetical protein DDY25_07195 [Peptococcaceae bacterium]|nr:hypothetical protein [Peptococcaceae bacterium]HBI27494.1 hypothetical protein [Peptococcaceae bacterium]
MFSSPFSSFLPIAENFQAITLFQDVSLAKSPGIIRKEILGTVLMISDHRNRSAISEFITSSCSDDGLYDDD